ncbi:MAG: hypothetical protein ACI4QR_01970 [Eubacteriales bacterium]
MKKEDLLSAFENIKPDDELKENTKLKMMNAVLKRESEKTKRPGLFARMSAVICTAMFFLVCVSSLGIQKFSPHEYYASVGDDSGVTAYEKQDLRTAPSAFVYTKGIESDEGKFRAFLSELSENYRAIGICGEIVSEKIYVCNDENEYGIYGFAILNVKIFDLFLSENEPFFGVKENDTVSFVFYLESYSEVSVLPQTGEECKIFAYSGNDMVPIDGYAEKFDLKNAFTVFR